MRRRRTDAIVTGADRIARATPNVTVKDAATSLRLQGLSAVHLNTLQQLDVLRRTRGMREVGSVQIPPHLQVGIPADVSGVEVRVNLAPIKG
jgi:hypothetical protein